MSCETLSIYLPYLSIEGGAQPPERYDLPELHMNPPYEPAPIDRYSRLFPPLDPPFELEAMEQLGKSMERAITNITEELEGAPLPAGYTYFGQFIDHDLTLDETFLTDALAFGSIPAETRNAADGRLNLNHLYGDGPKSAKHGHLYAADGASFRLGRVKSSTRERFDLPIGRGGPQSAEPRNNENLILRQLCGMFLKLHNQAVQELPASLDPFERFQRARNRVCWQYQYLVRKDYLPRIVTDKVFDRLVLRGRPKIDWQKKGFSIPVEFSQAAFRFGHSMVRAQYRLNSNFRDLLPLRKIFAGPQRFRSIPRAMAIDWINFLGAGPLIKSVPAKEIDTTIVPPLFRLPSKEVHHFTRANPPLLPPQLSVRTLQRGAITRLPTGEQVAKALGYHPLHQQASGRGEKAWEMLNELGLKGRTPLWYYILLEAEVERLGAGLGRVGSELVAGVIEGCLRTDPGSYISCFKSDWKPPAWRITTTNKMRPIGDLADVAVVTGLASLAA
jgi:hypothetical protein